MTVVEEYGDFCRKGVGESRVDKERIVGQVESFHLVGSGFGINKEVIRIFLSEKESGRRINGLACHYVYAFGRIRRFHTDNFPSYDDFCIFSPSRTRTVHTFHRHVVGFGDYRTEILVDVDVFFNSREKNSRLYRSGGVLQSDKFVNGVGLVGNHQAEIEPAVVLAYGAYSVGIKHFVENGKQTVLVENIILSEKLAETFLDDVLIDTVLEFRPFGAVSQREQVGYKQLVYIGRIGANVHHQSFRTRVVPQIYVYIYAVGRNNLSVGVTDILFGDRSS